MAESRMKIETHINSIPSWVKSVILLSITGVICYKIIITPFNLQFDFSAFLSLVLSIFSVALAAMFYFKATDTSNSFYDNTYKFSQEIAGLLVKIESGFGEKLTHLDDAYKGMRDKLDKIPDRTEIIDTKKELKKEEQEVSKILSEREELITDLAEKANLKNGEKEIFIKKLKEKDDSLKKAMIEIEYLRGRLARNSLPINKFKNRNFPKNDNDMMAFLKEVFYELGGEDFILKNPSHIIKERFRQLVPTLSKNTLNNLSKYDMIDIDKELTIAGYNFLVGIASELIYNNNSSPEDGPNFLGPD